MARIEALDIASKKAFAELESVGGDPCALPIPAQTIAVIYAMQGVVDNGGFKYFFESDWPNNPPYSMFAEAYRRIGAYAAADCFERAVAMFPFQNPHLRRDWRNEFMDNLPEDHEFFEVDSKVCGNKAIWDGLAAYTAANYLLDNDA